MIERYVKTIQEQELQILALEQAAASCSEQDAGEEASVAVSKSGNQVMTLK